MNTNHQEINQAQAIEEQNNNNNEDLNNIQFVNNNYVKTMEDIMVPQFIEQQNMIQEAGQQNSLASILQKTKQLQEKQQIQKYILLQQQKKVFDIYQNLYTKRKQLVNLLIQQFNQKIFEVDIGLYQQFNQLRQKINSQMKTIQKLRQDINKQGIGLNNDLELIKLKSKRQDIQNQIAIGKKFSSTQFIRDYLEKPTAYRVSYQDVKYEYQMRIRLKQTLQNQKKQYETKKQEISKAIKNQKAIQQQLEQQRDYYAKLLS